MKGRWIEVVKLTFKGKRFEDHALDVNALSEIIRFKKIVSETAKVLWREANRKEKLPKHFENRTKLYLRRIEPGSAVVPLETFYEEKEQLFEQEPVELKEAVELAHKTILAVDQDKPLPENFPKSLLPDFERWGEDLAEDETIEIIPPGKEPARLTPKAHLRLVTFAEMPYEAEAEIEGEVLAADIRLGRCQLWLDERTGIAVNFTPELEDSVTSALKDHNTCHLYIKGKGEYSPQGKLQRIIEIAECLIKPVSEPTLLNLMAPPIEEILSDLANEIPKEEWDKLPSDLTDNLDHYLYGTPK
jgi:hypothetical protein